MGHLDTKPARPGAVPQSSAPVQPQCDSAERAALPKLREMREDVFFRAEYSYLCNLVGLCGNNIKKACQVSGLSRSRLYSLLKKYQLSAPLQTPCPQK